MKQAVGRCILEHDTLGAPCDSRRDLVVGDACGQKHDLRPISIRSNAGQHVEPVQAGHSEVEHGEIRREISDRLRGGRAVTARGYDLQIRVQLQDTGHAVEHDRVIIGNNDRTPAP